ncbi:hypothetical protein Q4E93_21785 [Flavitalea sp. BT771]|nr:hypothetical protein [Flavitalea sp. BT771]
MLVDARFQLLVFLHVGDGVFVASPVTVAAALNVAVAFQLHQVALQVAGVDPQLTPDLPRGKS